MGGATSVMPVIRDVFSQQAAGTIDWTVGCDWPQVTSSRLMFYTHYANEGCKTCTSIAELDASFIVVVMAV